MKIACPSCSAKYSIADEKVQNRLAKIRCRKCGTTIVIDGKASPPTVQTADGAQAAADPRGGDPRGGDEYTVDLAENDQRPMTVEQIVEAYNNGTVGADTYVWKDGMADWQALADVPEINEALHRAAEAAQPAPIAHAAPVVHAPRAAHSAPPPASADLGAAAARTGAGRGSATDLFGGIDLAGSESDITTSAPESTAGGVAAATGARNESSVLFSLSALTAAAQDEKPRLDPATEDSGLIDLAALTSSSASMGAAPAMPALDLGSAPLAPSPLGGAPLIGGTTAPLGMDAMPPQQSGNRNGLLIGGGIVVATLLGGLFAFLLKDDPQPVAAAPTATVFVPTAAPTATTEVASAQGAKDEAKDEETGSKDEAEEAANEEEEEEEEETAQPSNTPTKRTRVVRRKSSSNSGSSSKKSSGSSSDSSKGTKSGSGSSSSSKKKKSSSSSGSKKKKKKCNCAPSDLMCAMKCSAG